jgi:hypothetical protein
MAQDGPGAAGQDGCHGGTVPGQAGMADRVNTTMDPVYPAR